MQAKRHPRVVHDDMEAIFGVPSSLNAPRRGSAADVNTHIYPEPEPRRGQTSTVIWIAAAVMLAVALSGVLFLIRGEVFHAYPKQSGQLASQALDRAYPSTEDKPAPASGRIGTVPASHCAGRVDANGNCEALPPPHPLPPPPALAYRPAIPTHPVGAPAQPATPPAATPTKATPASATDASAQAEAAKTRACEGTSYEHMAICPPGTVLKADKALSAAYAAAISANVDSGRLAYYSQRWSQMRETAASDPETTAEEFANMTSQLNALALTATSRKQ